MASVAAVDGGTCYTKLVLSRRMRVLLILSSAGLAAFSFARGQTLLAGLCASGGVLLVYGYLRYGSVMAAMAALRRGRLEEAARRHAETDPARLDGQSLAYYRWVSAAIAEARGNMDEATRYMAEAFHGALRTRHDRIIAGCTLSVMVARSGDRERARLLLAEARRIHTEAAPRRRDPRSERVLEDAARAVEKRS